MSGKVRLAMVAAFGCGLMSAAGCSRTSDGTVIMPTVPSMPSYMPSWRPWKWRRSEGPQPVAAQQSFTPAAEPAPRAGRSPRVSRPKGFDVRPRGDMECMNRTEPGGRVKVVCR